MFPFIRLIAAVSLAMIMSTQAIAEASRPKVGLVLGGGGARGAAHIGVLEVLEELKIPVDCIAGTSMGGIVGAVYASGAPVSEMETKVKAIDWKAVFQDRPDRRLMTERRKREETGYLARPEVGFRNEVIGTKQLGDITFVELPELEIDRVAGDVLAVEDDSLVAQHLLGPTFLDEGASFEQVHPVRELGVAKADFVQQIVDGPSHAVALGLPGDQHDIHALEGLHERIVVPAKLFALRPARDLGADHGVVLGERPVALDFELGLREPRHRVEENGFFNR